MTSLFSGWVSLDTTLADLAFALPEGTTRAQLEYLVTGHGGAMDPSSACIGAAEEFCQRTHHLTVDGAELTPEGLRPVCVCALARRLRRAVHAGPRPSDDGRVLQRKPEPHAGLGHGPARQLVSRR